MNKNSRWLARTLSVMTVVVLGSYLPPALADDAAHLDREVDTVLDKLYGKSPAAKDLAKNAKGILVFPDIIKAGFLVGAQYGKGALRKNGKTVAYYNTVAGSFGLQAGAQSFGYVLFFMNDSALGYLDSSDGLEIGVGPSVVMVDKGMAGSFTTTTAKDDIYAFTFDQTGLMAGMGLQGTKITKLKNP